MEHTVVFAGLSPHPPVIIPDIGGERLGQVSKTVEGLRQVMQRLVASHPDAVVIISPHAPRDPKSFSAYTGLRLKGDFAAFHAPHIELDLPNHVILLSRISILCVDAGLSMWMIPGGRRLDHGALVPLYFLVEAGWRSPLVVLGLPFNLKVDHVRFGECIAEAARQLNGRVAIVASGDMSHRLTPDGPYEYHPRAHVYDDQVVAAIATGAVNDLLSIDPTLRDLAAEDTYQSLLVALGATGRQFHNPKVCSYEGPFGVGYLTAVLADFTEDDSRAQNPDRADAEMINQPDTGEKAIQLARCSVEMLLTNQSYMTPPQPLSDKLAERAGVFVCIKRRNGELRGCVGTVTPTRKNIAEEIIYNAVAAATQDSRFAPVQPDEIGDLIFSVDILSPLEPVSSLTELDPKHYGLMVESDDGQRGLLLPNLVGIDTAEQQVTLAMRKADLLPGAPVKYYRFAAERICEGQRK
jgi:AmmeMemoRadiSam system protein A